MARVIEECTEALDAGRLDELAPAIIMDEILTEESFERLAQDEWLGPVWRFTEAFFDAAAHNFPDVGPGLLIDRARSELREVLEALVRGDRRVSDSAREVLSRFR